MIYILDNLKILKTNKYISYKYEIKITLINIK